MIKLQLIGNLGADAEKKSIESSKYDVIEFNVATTEKRGEKEVTTWVKVSKWVKPESRLAEYLKKGTKVFISGSPSAQAYLDRQEGHPKASLCVSANELELLSK
jgi:single-strand DNA-binding protein